MKKLAIILLLVARAVGSTVSGHLVLKNEGSQVLKAVIVETENSDGSWELITGPADIAPGTEISLFHSYDPDVSTGQHVRLSRRHVDYAVAGNSFVKTGDSENVDVVFATYSFPVGGGENLDDSGNVVKLDISEGGGGLSPVSTPDDQKTLWRVTDSELNADVYREGVDKIVYAVKSSSSSGSGGDTGGGTTTDPYATPSAIHATQATNAATALSSGLAPLATNINTAVGSMGPSSVGALPTPSSSSEFKLPSLDADDAGFHVQPNLFDLFPSVTDWATWIHEILLAIMMITFGVKMQHKFEKYYLHYWTIAPQTTKPDAPSIAAPPVGWGKQALSALTITTIFVTVISVVIASLNTRMGDLSPGTTFANLFSTQVTVVTDVLGNSAIAKTYALFSMFIPFGAAFQFVGASYIISWFMPVTWTTAMLATKYINI